jgi:hypothetical protein
MTKPNPHNKPDQDKPGYGAEPRKTPEDEVLKRPPVDDEAVRAKSERHGKVTADKWNQ